MNLNNYLYIYVPLELILKNRYPRKELLVSNPDLQEKKDDNDEFNAKLDHFVEQKTRDLKQAEEAIVKLKTESERLSSQLKVEGSETLFSLNFIKVNTVFPDLTVLN